MLRLMQRWLARVLCLCLSLGLAACSRQEAPAPEAAPAATAISVTSVDLGRSVGPDKRVTQSVSTFGPKDEIYASILTTGASPDAALRVRWTYQDGQVVDESERRIAPTGDVATEFHISKPDGWPAGKYKLEVFLNDAPVQTKEFEVH